ncbi:ATP-binding protein [Clostridium butyricum]|uniref:ATP-binding protein n=1 Tax=Clostridium butyricum TaxID=1492 RepID=UPI0012B8D8C3|nr:ATP-binding protein [Clostridium butyricum]
MKENMKNSQEKTILDSNFNVCPSCGETITYRDFELLSGKIMHLKIDCKCERERKAKEEEIENRKKLLREIDCVYRESYMEKMAYKDNFNNWDFSKVNKKIYDFGRKFCDKFDEISKNGLGLFIYGRPGNGKTYLTSCIANELIEKKQIKIKYCGINFILNQIKSSYDYKAPEEVKTIGKFKDSKLLILDDLGTEQVTEWSRNKIYEIIDYRYRNKLSTIITTNLNMDEITNKYTQRLADRMFEMCTKFEFTNESVRKQKAMENTEKIKYILKLEK